MPSFSCCTVFASRPAEARRTVPSATCQGMSHQSPRDPPRQLRKRVSPLMLPWRAGSVFTRDQRIAGRTPIAAAAATDTPKVKNTTLRSGETSRSPGVNRLAISGARPRAIQLPSRPPATPPRAASSRCSASNCRSNRNRPAPSEALMASSFLARVDGRREQGRHVEAPDGQDQNREETYEPQAAFGRRRVPLAAARNQADVRAFATALRLPPAVEGRAHRRQTVGTLENSGESQRRRGAGKESCISVDERRLRQRNPEVGAVADLRAGEARGSNADDGEDAAMESNRIPDDRRVGGEDLPPCGVAQDGYRLAVEFTEQPASRAGTDTQGVEVVPGHFFDDHALRAPIRRR